MKAEIEKWNEMVDKRVNDYLDGQKRDKLFSVPIKVYVWANNPEHAKEIVETEIILHPAQGFQWLDHILDVEDKTHG